MIPGRMGWAPAGHSCRADLMLLRRVQPQRKQDKEPQVSGPAWLQPFLLASVADQGLVAPNPIWDLFPAYGVCHAALNLRELRL